jgi:hypothetical protein
MDKVVHKAIVGSRIRGYDLEGSDLDIRGIFIQDFEVFASGLFEKKQKAKIGSDSEDSLYFELSHFVLSCIRGNFNFIEMLFAEGEFNPIRDPSLSEIFMRKNDFISCGYLESIRGCLISHFYRLTTKGDFKDISKLYVFSSFLLGLFDSAVQGKDISEFYAESRRDESLRRIRENELEFFGTDCEKEICEIFISRFKDKIHDLEIPKHFKSPPKKEEFSKIIKNIRLENQ